MTETTELKRAEEPTPTNPASVAFRFYRPNLSGYNLKMLVYGDPGVGKTTLAASAGNLKTMSDILAINIEGGMMSVIDAEETGLSHTPTVVDVYSWEDLEPIFWFLKSEPHSYRTIIIDSLSELAKLNIDSVVAQQVSTNRKRTNSDDIWLEDYGTSTKQMRRVLRAFRDLSVNVIFTCHAAMSKDETQVFPALTPKLRESVIGFMDVVAYMYTSMEKKSEEEPDEQVLRRKILTQPYGRFVAKDRSPGGRIGMVMTNPTMPQIMANILKEKVE